MSRLADAWRRMPDIPAAALLILAVAGLVAVVGGLEWLVIHEPLYLVVIALVVWTCAVLVETREED